MADDASTRDTFPYPGGNVVGVLPDAAALDDARERLEQAGFGPDHYDVLHGEDDAGRIDVKGEAHGLAGRIRRWLQAAFSDDAEPTTRASTQSICATVTTSSASPWATTRRPSSVPRTPCA